MNIETINEASERYSNPTGKNINTTNSQEYSKYVLEKVGFESGVKWLSDKTNGVIIDFIIWKDNNFLLYKDGKYYPKTSSGYFDITKYVTKEKPTKYYNIEELIELFNKK